MATITKAMSDTAIAGEVYARLEARRKNMSFTQEEMAEKIGVTPKSYRALETGKCRLATFIATLRHLDMLDNLDKMIAPVGVSPLEALVRTTTGATMPQFRVDVKAETNAPAGRINTSRLPARKSNIDVSTGGNPIMSSRQKLVVKG